MKKGIEQSLTVSLKEIFAKLYIDKKNVCLYNG